MPPRSRSKPNNANIIPYKIYNKEFLTSSRQKDINQYTICAIDPAIKNCAIRVEGPDKKTIFQDKFNFVPVKTGKRGGIIKERTLSDDKNNSITILIDIFFSIKDQLSKSDFILIESQHHKNKDMLKTSSAIITTLLILFKDIQNPPIIIEIDPKVKSSPLFMKEDGLPKPLKKPELKKWASKKGLEILLRNDDKLFHDKISKEKKLDDHGDVICYTECFRKSFLTDQKWVNKLFNQ